jgi:hypothetical protein
MLCNIKIQSLQFGKFYYNLYVFSLSTQGSVSALAFRFVVYLVLWYCILGAWGVKWLLQFARWISGLLILKEISTEFFRVFRTPGKREQVFVVVLNWKYGTVLIVCYFAFIILRMCVALLVLCRHILGSVKWSTPILFRYFLFHCS